MLLTKCFTFFKNFALNCSPEEKFDEFEKFEKFKFIAELFGIL